MFYKYESDFDNDLMFWSNATADIHFSGKILKAGLTAAPIRNFL